MTADGKGGTMEGTDTRRRRFLGAGLAAGGIALAPGVLLYVFGDDAAAREAGEPASASVRWGLLIDVNKCGIDCDICVTACVEEHGLEGRGRPATDPQWIRVVRVRDPRTGRRRSLPMLCQHCAYPPCVDVCPTGASFRRADGIVLVDRHLCIGCRYCMMACPYKARSFVHEEVENQKPYAPRGRGTVEACTLCVHRVDVGRVPACVEACAERGAGAMLFGDLKDGTSEIAKRVAAFPTTRVRDDLGLDTGVYYIGV